MFSRSHLLNVYNLIPGDLPTFADDYSSSMEKLIKKAKQSECVLILICHNTKAGQIKGSSLIIHAVDVNIAIEPIKDAEINARKIVFNKNRFGPATDIECNIEYRGYDFQTEVVINDEDVNKSSKSKKKQEQKDAIVSINDKITLPKVCKLLNIDSTRAGFLLRELLNEGWQRCQFNLEGY